MKTNEAPICKICTARLQNYGFICFKIIDEICKSASEDDISYYDDKHSSKEIRIVIRFLEQKRFIISTEISKTRVAMRPYGHYEIEEGDFFCWCENR